MAVITEIDKFEFSLYVLDVTANPADLKDATVIIGQKLGNEMNPFFNMSDRSITWSYTLGGNTWVWSAIFADEAQDIAFKDFFSRCLFETTSRTPFGKVKEEDKTAIVNTLRDYVERDADAMDPVEPDSPDEEQKILQAMNSLSLKSKHSGGVLDDDDEEEEKDDDEDEDEEEEEKPRARDDDEEEILDDEKPTRKGFRLGSKNKLLSVSSRNHRALVSRGNKIGVFTADNLDSGLQFETCISGFGSESSGKFTPRRMMLHHGEDELLMLHPAKDEHKKVFEMDLGTGKIVSEWGTEDYPINEILPQSKYAPQTLTKTMVGMNRVGFFMMDPRLPGASKRVPEKTFFSLASHPPGFTCAATTANGEIVLGTEKGEVRLYDSKKLAEGKPGDMSERQPRAKTTFIGYGDPIKGLDVTHDGKWIVATCSKYLLLIKTDDASGNSGYVKSIGKNKVAPRRLHLKPKDMRALGDIDFTPAKFDLGDDSEKSIVTSTGPFVITWNFLKAKQNKLDYYRIVRLPDVVVADQFRFGDADSVVVAMPDDVTLTRSTVPKTSRR